MSGKRRETLRLPKAEEDEPTGNKFGTFGGVFTPSILTILGVIMFMRSGFVVGEAGLFGALAILLIAKVITGLTALSVSAISTNMQVRGGGAYFMISRVLGPEFGGAIGLALFFAQALSVPFYILGFTEAVVRSNPNLAPHFQTIALISGAALFVVAWIGASWAIKTQYLIMGVLFAAIFVMLGGLILDFDMSLFEENLGPGYSPIDPTNPAAGNYTFWMVFAIYFPAVTGILAGVNMSGDLKDPARSIPKGTFYALGVSAVIYAILAFLLAGSVSHTELIDHPFRALKDHVLWKTGWLVSGGVYAASLSSALGSYLGAPRILQAVARDDILGWIKPFAKGTEQGDEPRRALILTGIMTLVVLLWAGNDSDGGPLNAVAAIITMFFLYTYGMTNLAAFIEALSKNPSFRPRFRFFHWSTALLGAIGCVGVALLINALAALIAFLILAGLLWFITTRELETTFGDARRGFFYSALRNNLLRLSAIEEDSKNWRPTILVFSGNPSSRETLCTYAVWLEAGRGIVLLANLMVGDLEEERLHRDEALSQLREFCDSKDIQAFPVIAVTRDVRQSILTLLQGVSIGPVRPSLTMFGWPSAGDTFADLAVHLRTAQSLGISQVLIRDRGLPKTTSSRASERNRIDVWWRGRRNGELMVILAHLLTRNWEWVRSRMRIIRLVEDELERADAEQELGHLLEEARVDAEVLAIVAGGKSFSEILYQTSRDATCVFLGFRTPEEGEESEWFERTNKMLKGLPTTLIVGATGTEDMSA